jgi:hypothetical protein
MNDETIKEHLIDIIWNNPGIHLLMPRSWSLVNIQFKEYIDTTKLLDELIAEERIIAKPIVSVTIHGTSVIKTLVNIELFPKITLSGLWRHFLIKKGILHE